MSGDFSPEQKRYLEGFVSGLSASRLARASAPVTTGPAGPDAIHIAAQDKVIAGGGKLSEQETIKRELHPFDAYHRLVEQATRDEAPKPADNFRWRYFGLFYVAPTQTSYMCRLRIPNGILDHRQFEGLAGLSERFGGGYLHVTTRANIQIREIAPSNAVAMLEAIQDLGLCSRGSGADNIRNVTGTPTAGIDPREILDTRPYARAWHFHVLNDRSLNGLPRKFNVAFDGGGSVAVLEETNDIAFQAVEVRDGYGLTPGVYFRLALGGITGHKDFARDTGVVLPPAEATEIADRVVRVFSEHGDRTNRNRARLKYVLDARGLDWFLAAVEDRLGRRLTRVSADAISPRPVYDRLAHIGAHPQKQDGLNWIGVAMKLGRLTPDQVRGLAAISRAHGDGDIRLTVWQNLILSGVPTGRVAAALAEIKALGLDTEVSPIRAGLVACTGGMGCRFAAASTKQDADAIADHCESRIAMDTPVNIHLTGCHNSCAQHYIGDIGLIGARVPLNDEGDSVDGYHLFAGGGYGVDAAIAREVMQNIKAENAPAIVSRLLDAYMARRASAEETFVAFTRRHDAEALRRMAEGAPE